MFTIENHLKKLPQVDVIPPSLELDSATSMRGNIFIMEAHLISLYESYHLEQNIQSKLELALEIYSINKGNRMPEYWHDLDTPLLDGEKWALINRWRLHYEASSFGRIRCWFDYTNGGEVKLIQPRLIKQHFSKSEGYLLCGINIKRKLTVPNKVNWLVANAFYDNSIGLPQSNHIDGVKTNNHLINLELCSRSYNMKHAHYLKLRPFSDNDSHHQRKLTKDDVHNILESDLEYSKLAEKYQVAIPTIRRVKMGETYKHITKGIKNRIRREKLSPDIALKIFNSSKKTMQLCAEYNTTEWVVQRIKSGETFSNITGKKHIKA